MLRLILNWLYRLMDATLCELGVQLSSGEKSDVNVSDFNRGLAAGNRYAKAMIGQGVSVEDISQVAYLTIYSRASNRAFRIGFIQGADEAAADSLNRISTGHYYG